MEPAKQPTAKTINIQFIRPMSYKESKHTKSMPLFSRKSKIFSSRSPHTMVTIPTVVAYNHCDRVEESFEKKDCESHLDCAHNNWVERSIHSEHSRENVKHNASHTANVREVSNRQGPGTLRKAIPAFSKKETIGLVCNDKSKNGKKVLHNRNKTEISTTTNTKTIDEIVEKKQRLQKEKEKKYDEFILVEDELQQEKEENKKYKQQQQIDRKIVGKLNYEIKTQEKDNEDNATVLRIKSMNYNNTEQNEFCNQNENNYEKNEYTIETEKHFSTDAINKPSSFSKQLRSKNNSRKELLSTSRKRRKNVKLKYDYFYTGPGGKGLSARIEKEIKKLQNANHEETREKENQHRNRKNHNPNKSNIESWLRIMNGNGVSSSNKILVSRKLCTTVVEKKFNNNNSSSDLLKTEQKTLSIRGNLDFKTRAASAAASRSGIKKKKGKAEKQCKTNFEFIESWNLKEPYLNAYYDNSNNNLESEEEAEELVSSSNTRREEGLKFLKNTIANLSQQQIGRSRNRSRNSNYAAIPTCATLKAIETESGYGNEREEDR